MAVESSDGEQTKRQNTLPDTVTSVTIPASITTIGAQAFAYSKIEKVTLEANSKLTEICAEAFYNTPITEFTLPESVKEVGNLAFGNTLLNKLTLNANLEPMEQTRGVYPTYLEEQQDGYYAYDDTLAVSGNQYYSLAWQVLDLVNQERAEQGLTALTMDKDFLSAAMQRAAKTSISFFPQSPNRTGLLLHQFKNDAREHRFRLNHSRRSREPMHELDGTPREHLELRHKVSCPSQATGQRSQVPAAGTVK